MAYWIFRCNPELYEIDERLNLARTDTTWRVSRYRNEVSPGDVAFIWRGGAKRGICAVIEVDSIPMEMEELEHEREFCTKLSTDKEVRVRAHICNRQVFIDEQMIKEDPNLSNLSIFGFNQATNYRVTPEEGRRLEQLVSESSA